ncbi:hypothetical protein [Intestinibacter bartlettii]|jgi:hypothetical protein|uniref:hypothetical protein n=1 Tax=Intestinibacter bartlettii TaxID=261299 RepID=UPI003995627C
MLKSIPIAKYFEIQSQEYVYLKLIPSKSIRNNRTYSILDLVNKMYLNINKLIKIEDNKLIIKTQLKASYYIHITKEKINFYFIVPKLFYSKFRVKFKEIWKSVEIKEVNSIPIITGSQYQLIYKNKDFLSTSTDMRNNDLLSANLSAVELLQDGEEAGILYNFLPTSEKQCNYFKSTCQKFIREYKNTNVKYTSNAISNLIIKILSYSIDFINSTLNFLFDVKQVDKQINFNKLSNNTNKKATSDICKTQIILSSKAKTTNKEKSIIDTISNSYSVIEDDNKFICKKIKHNIRNLNTSIYECGNFIALPGADIIQQFPQINHNRVYNKDFPKCLATGDILIGNSIKNMPVYYSTDKEISRLGRVLIGGMGCGKTHYMQNLAKSIIAKGDGLVVLDIIRDCNLAESIKQVTPKDRLIEIDCSNHTQLQGFCYNELICNSSDKYRKLAKCMEKGTQLHILLNTINSDTKLTPRMLRYFYAACTVVFYKNINASFKEIIEVLIYPDIRKNILERLSESEIKLLSDEIKDLCDLDKVNKNGTIENYDSKIDGIIDRISMLKTNLYTKLAYNTQGNNNIDFVKALDQNKVIIIKAREEDFTNRNIRDLIATFYLSKVWLAKQIKANTRTEIFIDEINLFPTAQIILQDILTECRKYSFIPTISLHFLDQCSKKCKNAILSSGCNFLLLAGADVKCFIELKELFNKEGYTETDLLELKRYHALCLIRNEDNVYSAFVVKLPK